MRPVWAAILAVVSFLGCDNSFRVSADKASTFLNDWVVEIPGGPEVARQVADLHGFALDRPFRSIPDHYLLKKLDAPSRSKRSSDHHTQKLSDDYRVKFVEQQDEKVRVKRGYEATDVNDNKKFSFRGEESTDILNDPNFNKQWYIHNNDAMGVVRAWNMGLSGRGVSVTILDDGLEKNHPDLKDNYDPLASYDFNDDDDDPSPRYEQTNENKHGTRCGGEVAMVANNTVCGVGVAFNAGIGGIRMLDGKVTDHVESEAFGFCHRHVDICSASWGPNDDGKTLEKPGIVAAKGLMKSINEGRNGSGTIMVWAAGNGAHHGDNCNCDGYSSSIYTLSVSSASERGLSPWYAEKCASTLAATYSSGTGNDRKVVSSDLHGLCTDEHTGTSAAAPMAAGLLALALEQNPNLTWRDVQHLVVATSKYEPVKNERGWYKNGVGLCANHAFGFGLMDAGALATMADPNVWEPVGEQKICKVPASNDEFPKYLESNKMIEVNITTDGCRGQDQEINYVEHVQVEMTLNYTNRGNIYVELESPAGTITPLMLERHQDHSKKGFVKWPLTSVHNWGENPSGTWKVRVADRFTFGIRGNGYLNGLNLILYGTKEKPFYHDSLKNNSQCPDLLLHPMSNAEREAIKARQQAKMSKAEKEEIKLKQQLKEILSGNRQDESWNLV